MIFVIVRAQQSSRRQQKYFGNWAWRPYLNISLENPNLLSDEVIKHIIIASFYDEEVPGVYYEKYFGLAENEVFEFDYAKKYQDEKTGRIRFEKYRRISL